MRVTLTTALVPTIELCLFTWIDIGNAARTQRLQTSNVPSFDWSAVEPSSNLKWNECYSPSSTEESIQHILSPVSTAKSRKLSCALLSLPLDYHNSTNPNNVSVPVLKVSSPPSSSHRGTIIIALGGAGNSRIQDLVAISSTSDLLDGIDQDFEYDFLAFDNRGFGYSSPSAKCFDSVLEGALWEQRMADLGGVMSTGEGDEAMQVRLAAARAKGELCAKQSEEDTDIRRHMTTAYAARDMLEILKRLGDHSSQSSNSFNGKSKDVGISKLNFLGLSYGTVVGQTFASLWPERVSRMILDGTGDVKDWTAKWQLQFLIDADAIWASFFDDCFEAKEACPLWRASDSNSSDMENRVTEFVENLKQRPLYTVSGGNARLITYRDMKLAIYWTTMSPGVASPFLATILDDLMRGQTNVTLEFPFESFPTASDCQNNPDSRASSNADAGMAINCGDAEDNTNSTIEDFREYLSALEDESSVAAFFQGERSIRCMGWPMRPAWRFTGPFSSKTNKGGSKLSTPILFMGNKLDPMTSLRNAHKVAKDYPGSVVLEQNARGHCALVNVIPTSCTLGHLRTYFRDGTLPEPGTVCGDDCNLFDGSCLDEEKFHSARLLLQRIWMQ